MPVRILLTAGTTADCTQAQALIEGLNAQHLLADRGYDSDAIVEQATEQGMQVVIPPRKNRKQPRTYDGPCIVIGIGSKMPFYNSSAGEGSPPVMPKMPLRFWRRPKSAASPYGLESYDDTV